MKKAILFSLVVLLFAACGTKEEVVLKYDNGTPRLVVIKKGDIRIGEKLFYENGQLRAEKHFSGKEETPSGKWSYYYASGALFAQGNFDKDHTFGSDWIIQKESGASRYDLPTDSLKVVEMTDNLLPSTIYYYNADSIRVFQFYEDYTLRSTGIIRQEKLDGLWRYYYPSGQTQVEAHYVQGKEDGIYCSFRENGVPYFRGIYTQGTRSGIWEFYDEQGNLSGKKEFGN